MMYDIWLSRVLSKSGLRIAYREYFHGFLTKLASHRSKSHGRNGHRGIASPSRDIVHVS